MGPWVPSPKREEGRREGGKERSVPSIIAKDITISGLLKCETRRILESMEYGFFFSFFSLRQGFAML
jgi:hypothetical protein